MFGLRGKRVGRISSPSGFVTLTQRKPPVSSDSPFPAPCSLFPLMNITKACLIRLFELEHSLNYLVSSIKDARVILIPDEITAELHIHVDCPVEAAELIRKSKVIYRTISRIMNVTWLTIHDKNFSIEYSEQDFILEFEDKDILKKDKNMSTDLLERSNTNAIGAANLLPPSNYININGIIYAPVNQVEVSKNGAAEEQEDRIARLEALMEKVIAAVSSNSQSITAPVAISDSDSKPKNIAVDTKTESVQSTEEKPVRISDKKLPRQVPRLICYTSSTKMVREGIKSIDPTGALHVDICDEILGKSKLGDKYMGALMIGFEHFDSKKVSKRQDALLKAIIEYRVKLTNNDSDSSSEAKLFSEEVPQDNS